jgi:peptidoglycan/LPS O-acetylase OafA/YrhL
VSVEKNNNFTLLRFVFAMFVVASHVVFLPGIDQMHWLKKYIPSLIGLQGFFVVSGFLVVMSYERSKGLGDYASKRLKRILPAYVLVVVTCALLLQTLSSYSFSEYFSSVQFWKYLGANLTFLNFVAPDLPGVFSSNMMTAVNGSLWTIKIELAFYVAVPFLIFLTRRYGTVVIFLLFFFLSIVWRIWFEHQYSVTGLQIYKTLAFQAPGQFSFFLCGAASYLFLKRGGKPPNFLMAVVAILAYNFTPGYAYHVIAPIAIAVITCWAAYGIGSVDFVSRYGDFSYGVYLYHWPIIQVLTAVGLFAWDYRVGAIVCVVLTIGLSVVSWFTVERPAVRIRAV